MVNFYPLFVSCGPMATLEEVAGKINHCFMAVKCSQNRAAEPNKILICDLFQIILTI